jgi:P pilus assembly chaperone PapD
MKRRDWWRAAARAALHAVILGWASASAAASLDVVPTRIEIASGSRSATVTLHNLSDAEISMQADPVDWSQDEWAEDRYESTPDLLVVPRIFAIPPGEKQVVRIGLPVAWTGGEERAFRVFFTELAPSGLAENETGVLMRLRIGVPVFAAPATTPAPALDLVRAGQAVDAYEVVLANAGNTHLTVGDIRAVLASGAGPETVAADWSGYLLPGRSRRIRIPVPVGSRVAAIRAHTDLTGPEEYVLPQHN